MSRTNRSEFKGSCSAGNGYLFREGFIDKEWKVTRDKKEGPTKTFKKLRRRAERAKAKAALQKGQEPDLVKKNDHWDWW